MVGEKETLKQNDINIRGLEREREREKERERGEMNKEIDRRTGERERENSNMAIQSRHKRWHIISSKTLGLNDKFLYI